MGAGGAFKILQSQNDLPGDVGEWFHKIVLCKVGCSEVPPWEYKQ